MREKFIKIIIVCMIVMGFALYFLSSKFMYKYVPGAHGDWIDPDYTCNGIILKNHTAEAECLGRRSTLK